MTRNCKYCEHYHKHVSQATQWEDLLPSKTVMQHVKDSSDIFYCGAKAKYFLKELMPKCSEFLSLQILELMKIRLQEEQCK